MSTLVANKPHPFERTLGLGPYKFVGFFTINIQAGQQGRPYYNKDAIHPRFVRGAGTCAHCGMGILNICQVQIGNGDVYGVDTDCIAKVDLDYVEKTKIEKAVRIHRAQLRADLKERKHRAAREAAQKLMAEHAELLASLPHPRGMTGLTWKDYADWCIKNSSNAAFLHGALIHVINKGSL